MNGLALWKWWDTQGLILMGCSQWMDDINPCYSVCGCGKPWCWLRERRGTQQPSGPSSHPLGPSALYWLSSPFVGSASFSKSRWKRCNHIQPCSACHGLLYAHLIALLWTTLIFSSVLNASVCDLVMQLTHFSCGRDHWPVRMLNANNRL